MQFFGAPTQGSLAEANFVLHASTPIWVSPTNLGRSCARLNNDPPADINCTARMPRYPRLRAVTNSRRIKVYCMVLYDWLGIIGIIIFVVSAGLLFEVAARVSGRRPVDD